MLSKLISIFLCTLFLLTTLINNLAIAEEPPAPCHCSSNKQKLIDEPIKDSIVEVKLSMPEVFKQGDSVIVYVDTKKELIEPKISFAGNNSKLYKLSEGKYRGIAGTEATTKAGGYTLKAYDDNDSLAFSKQIEVYPGKFPIQNIKISGKKASLTATEDELKKVADAKSLISNLSYWETRPFEVPTSGCVISVYGLNRYHNGKSTGDFHKGYDIKAPAGTPIVAMTAGKVLIAEPFRLHGKTVAIDHGQGLMSIYIHMSSINVKKGDKVKKGELIGKVGSSGFATGPHLHWGVYVNGLAVNPFDWVKPVKKCW